MRLHCNSNGMVYYGINFVQWTLFRCTKQLIGHREGFNYFSSQRGQWRLPASKYISRQSILKQGFQKTHFQMVLEVEIFLLSIWLTSKRCAKFQIPNSILTWFFRHLNMAFLGYFTQFRIAELARFCAIFIIFLTGSLLFPVIFSIEFQYFELQLNQLTDF